MKWGRARIAGRDTYVRFDGDRVQPLSNAPFAGGNPIGDAVALSDATLLAPVIPGAATK